jgi:hypothetical protein
MDTHMCQWELPSHIKRDASDVPANLRSILFWPQSARGLVNSTFVGAWNASSHSNGSCGCGGLSNTRLIFGRLLAAASARFFSSLSHTILLICLLNCSGFVHGLKASGGISSMVSLPPVYLHRKKCEMQPHAIHSAHRYSQAMSSMRGSCLCKDIFC